MIAGPKSTRPLPPTSEPIEISDQSVAGTGRNFKTEGALGVGRTVRASRASDSNIGSRVVTIVVFLSGWTQVHQRYFRPTTIPGFLCRRLAVTN